MRSDAQRHTYTHAPVTNTYIFTPIRSDVFAHIRPTHTQSASDKFIRRHSTSPGLDGFCLASFRPPLRTLRSIKPSTRETHVHRRLHTLLPSIFPLMAKEGERGPQVKNMSGVCCPRWEKEAEWMRESTNQIRWLSAPCLSILCNGTIFFSIFQSAPINHLNGFKSLYRQCQL
jgi:hypothetical protein